MLNEQHLSGCQIHRRGEEDEDKRTWCPSSSKTDHLYDLEACLLYFLADFFIFFWNLSLNVVLFRGKRGIEECMKGGPSKGPSMGLSGGGGVAERH